LSEIRQFFRHCPNCGKRFEIHLVSKEELPVEDKTVSVGGAPNPVPYAKVQSGGQPMGYVNLVDESRAITVDIHEFRYSYKCGHCGHAWSETEIKE
jgi:DNA-directed RNA polymerase subunit RPC12/RpoP